LWKSKPLEDRTFFAVTQKGLILRKYFQEKDNTPLIVKEAQNNAIPL